MNPDIVLTGWCKLGVMFNVSPAKNTPDIENLLIDTAAVLPQNARLLPVAVTWLCKYYRLVCRHRLAGFAAKIVDGDVSAALGLILDIVKSKTGIDHFNLAIKQCQPAKISKPLFIFDRKTKKLSLLARAESSDMARKWGLWCSQVQLKNDAVRPIKWIMAHNPPLKQRAIFGGNLKVSILESLARDSQAGQSESALSRYCYATRKAIREALDHLEFCQIIRRESIGAKVRIILA